MAMSRTDYDNYDDYKSWDENMPGWYQYTVTVKEVEYCEEIHKDIINWMYDNIGKCHRHTRWRRNFECIYVKFRYERDYILFMLRWG
jgi:hypothetical protein